MHPSVARTKTKGNEMSTTPEHMYNEVRDYYAEAARAAETGRGVLRA